MPLISLSAPPTLEPISQGGQALSMTWIVWFTQLYKVVTQGAVTTASADIGMKANGIYVVDSTSLVTLTLPQSFGVGDTFTIIGKGTGGWKIAQNALQTIHSTTSTTTGTGGSVSSANRYDNIVLQGMTTDLELSAISRNGSLIIV